MQLKTQLMDESAIDRALTRIAHEIVEQKGTLEELCLIGIERRGLPIAKILQHKLKQISGLELPLGALDIRFYRDDLSQIDEHPVVNPPKLPFSVHQKDLILIDDVLYTGRSVRAAIEALFQLGRPNRIRLAILIDRGHRELPIKPDFVGKNIPSSQRELIQVSMPPFEQEAKVMLYELNEQELAQVHRASSHIKE